MRVATLAAIALTSLLLVLLASLDIIDADLGRHVAIGRLLLSDFGGVRHMTMGQAPEILKQAYSYWIYEILVAGIYDGIGPAGIVLLRIILLIASFAGALLLARRLRAPAWTIAFGLLLALLVSQERFLDRPELFSFLAWIAALWILMTRRGGRAEWWLVPLQLLWVNTHIWFGLLPALFVAFSVGDRLDGRGDIRRDGKILAALVVATFAGPAGPGSWQSQLYLVQFLGKNYSLPFQIAEMMSPFSGYEAGLAVWAFRIALPIVLAVVIIGRRRIGWGAIFALLITVVLAARARRAMPLFAMTSAVLFPVALTDLVGRMRTSGRQVAAAALTSLVLLTAAAGLWGIASNRFFLVQDFDRRIGFGFNEAFSALDASCFLREEKVQGPIFHHPLAAGAIVMENGTRLPPFLDARWVGTPETIEAYQAIRTATDQNIREIWQRLDRTRHFEVVVLDFYEMPALLRYLSVDNPEWGTVHVDINSVVLCRRHGANERVMRDWEPKVLLATAARDPRREQALGDEILRFTRSARPSPLAPLHFPYPPFYRANYALQIRNREDAQVAYLDLLRSENGSLHASRHRADILNNMFWCLLDSKQYAAIDALVEALVREPSVTAEQRRSLRLQQARALESLGAGAKAEQIARAIAGDPESKPMDRWAAWCRIASVHTRSDDYATVADCLTRAAEAIPSSAETFRSLGAVYDFKLSKPREALDAYSRFVALGGKDPDVDQRIRVLRGQTGAGSTN
jgi:hypothetical protein